MSDTSLPLPVAALAEHALGATITHIAPTVGGFSNLSRRILIGGRSCVIKAAQLPIKRADLRHEASILPLLPALDVPAPHLIAFAEDDSWSVLISAELPGQPGVTLLETNHADLPAAFGALGTLLARLHTARAPNLPHLDLVPRLAAARTMLATAADIDDDLRRGLVASLHAASWDERAPRLIHGDAGMHNLLWDGSCAALLDWEWAAAGPPALDLAWLRWTIRWRRLPEDLWQVVLRAYTGEAAGLHPYVSAIDLDMLALGQIAMILAHVADQPAARAEWLRRARWTIQ